MPGKRVFLKNQHPRVFHVWQLGDFIEQGGVDIFVHLDQRHGLGCAGIAAEMEVRDVDLRVAKQLADAADEARLIFVADIEHAVAEGGFERHVAKRYLATLARPLQGDEAARFASGELLLEGEDKPLAPAVMEPLSATTVWLTVSEGRYHQVRRMFAAVGNHVEALHRDRVGGLDLPLELEPGRFRLMGAADIAAVFSGT